MSENPEVYLCIMHGPSAEPCACYLNRAAAPEISEVEEPPKYSYGKKDVLFLNKEEALRKAEHAPEISEADVEKIAETLSECGYGPITIHMKNTVRKALRAAQEGGERE